MAALCLGNGSSIRQRIASTYQRWTSRKVKGFRRSWNRFSVLPIEWPYQHHLWPWPYNVRFCRTDQVLRCYDATFQEWWRCITWRSNGSGPPREFWDTNQQMSHPRGSAYMNRQLSGTKRRYPLTCVTLQTWTFPLSCRWTWLLGVLLNLHSHKDLAVEYSEFANNRTHDFPQLRIPSNNPHKQHKQLSSNITT